MATNAALVAAKAAGRKPQDIAAALVAALQADPLVAEAGAAGPGFVNLRLRAPAWRGLLPLILRAGEAYGDSDAGAGVRVNVEYVSANPTGPMHIGHCRGAVVGDALANLLAKAGYRRDQGVLCQRRRQPGDRARLGGVFALFAGARTYRSPKMTSPTSCPAGCSIAAII